MKKKPHLRYIKGGKDTPQFKVGLTEMRNFLLIFAVITTLTSLITLFGTAFLFKFISQ